MRKHFCEERKLSATVVTARIEPRQKRSKKPSLQKLHCISRDQLEVKQELRLVAKEKKQAPPP